ncbi:MAG TPA: CheR family methyltransferase, partial [Polyangiaceae bacterium]|nr:CheR family methyltransferase [Polyangiaceae bacterium]
MPSPDSMAFLQELVHRRSGIVLEDSKDYLVDSRLSPIVRSENLCSIDELVTKLRREPGSALALRVTEAMTTNETLFFRDSHPFEALKSRFVPDLLQSRATRRSLRIWSAAAATGQEPYSIAMTLLESFPELASWDVRILATDLNNAVLERAREGRYRELEVPGRGLGASVAIRVWEPADADERPLRLLIAHDGPEYDALASLTRFTAAKIAAEELPPHRVALLAPGDRDQWYSASKRYGRVVAHDVIPALRDAFPTVGSLAGMGASLGALAMLHVQRSFPRAFGGLFLQSGSFFLPRTDPQERRFPRFARIVRFVRATQRDGALALAIPVTLTVGAAEENAANNRTMALALAEQGYEVELEEVPDMHNYTGWRDAFDPHL